MVLDIKTILERAETDESWAKNPNSTRSSSDNNSSPFLSLTEGMKMVVFVKDPRVNDDSKDPIFKHLWHNTFGANGDIVSRPFMCPRTLGRECLACNAGATASVRYGIKCIEVDDRKQEAKVFTMSKTVYEDSFTQFLIVANNSIAEAGEEGPVVSITRTERKDGNRTVYKTKFLPTTRCFTPSEELITSIEPVSGIFKNLTDEQVMELLTEKSLQNLYASRNGV